MRLAIPLLALLLASRVASAQEPRTVELALGADAAAIATCLAGGLLFSLLPVDVERRTEAELFGFDHSLRGQFSASANAASNTLIFANILVPIAMHASLGVTNELSRIAIVFTEAISISYLLNAAAKHVVQRPRPYVYSDDPFVKAFSKSEGIDTHLSFYSGHASMAFTAAVAGSYMYALRTNDEAARALIWGINLAMASATANLRVRSGKHFYSDVFVGTMLGVGIGLLVPIIHQSESHPTYEPSTGEIATMAGGFVLGILVSELAPIDRDIVLPLEVVPKSSETQSWIELRLDVLRLFGS
jgi:membrane-associated phospholipid phosphatase